MNRQQVFLILAGLLVLRPAFAADLSILDYSVEGKNRYDRCLELIKRDPAVANDQADGWVKTGGGAAALHCQGLALVELKRSDAAAAKFEQAAHDHGLANPGERAALLDQAGNAWLLAGKPDKADGDFSAALIASPSDEDVLTDRARARGLRKDWAGAEADLSAVISLDPNRADALVLRARAVHAQGRTDDARSDVARALDVDPDYPEALIERGNIKLEAGDAAGARTDWQRVVTSAPGTDAAAAAKIRLQSLGAKPVGH